MKNKKESKRQTLLQCRGSSGSKEIWCFVQDASHLCVCLELCQRPACCIQQRCGCRRGGESHFGQDFFFFFFCPENRPWFPGTMQLMRASPRKIRLWHHGFLKHTAEPTLSPAIIKSQWISTVDWNWEKENLQFWSFTWVFWIHSLI